MQRLINLFATFPGIGPKQATRFVFYVLKNNLAEDLRRALKELKEQVTFCSKCFKTTEITSSAASSYSDEVHKLEPLCIFCRDPKRDPTLIAVVEKESDLQNLEKTDAYRGLYHVLGGIVDPLDSDSPRKLHLRQLFERVKHILEKENICEVLLATNPTTEGDTTALYIEKILEPLKKRYATLKISRLGRGLSLGSELEHVDEITIKQALANRKAVL